jgi:hypothetical protein
MNGDDRKLFRHPEPPIIPPKGYIKLLTAVSLAAEATGPEAVAKHESGTNGAEGLVRRLCRDGAVSAVMVRHTDGRPFQIPAGAWSHPVVPMFFNDGTFWHSDRPGDADNGFWASIYVLESELASALDGPAPYAKASTSDLSANLSTAAGETRAIARCAELLRENNNLTREDAQIRLRQEGLPFSERGFLSRIWPKARQGAGLSEKASPGRKPKSKIGNRSS